MEILMIVMWSAVALLSVGWLPFAPRFAWWVLDKLDERNRPGRGGARTRGCHKRTRVVYHDYEEDAR